MRQFHALCVVVPVFLSCVLCLDVRCVRGEDPTDAAKVTPDQVRKEYATILRRFEPLGYDREKEEGFFVDSVLTLRKQRGKLAPLIALYRDSELERAHAIADPLLAALPKEAEEPVPAHETGLQSVQRWLAAERHQCERLLEKDDLSEKEKVAAMVLIEGLRLRSAFQRFFGNPKWTDKCEGAFQFCETMSAINEIHGASHIDECQEILRLGLATKEEPMLHVKEEEVVRWVLGASIIFTPHPQESQSSWAQEFFHGRFQNPPLDEDKGDAAGWLLRWIAAREGMTGELKGGKTGLRLLCQAFAGRSSLTAAETSVVRWILSEIADAEADAASDWAKVQKNVAERNIEAICGIFQVTRPNHGERQVVEGAAWKYKLREERPKGSGNWIEGVQWTSFRLNGNTGKIEIAYAYRPFGDDTVWTEQYHADYEWVEKGDWAFVRCSNFRFHSKEGWKASDGTAILAIQRSQLKEKADSLFVSFMRKDTHFLSLGQLEDGKGLAFQREAH